MHLQLLKIKINDTLITNIPKNAMNRVDLGHKTRKNIKHQ